MSKNLSYTAVVIGALGDDLKDLKYEQVYDSEANCY